MKTIILFLLTLLFSSSLIAQEKHKEYYDNGKLKESGQYDANGKGYGTWKFYTKNGELECIRNYLNGRTNGEVKYYYSNGKVERISHYSNAVETGTWKRFDRNGQLKEVESYTDGELDGERKEYNNGQLKEVENYIDGELDGEYKRYENGVLESSGRYRNGLKEGEWKLYYTENDVDYDGELKGKLYREYNFAQGKLIESVKEHDYTLNHEIVKNLNGRYVVESIYMLNTGYVLIEEGDEDEDLTWLETKEGVWKSYDKNNILRIIGSYVDGDESGDWVWYYPSGNIKETGSYSDGEKIGEWKSYHKNGELDQIIQE